MVLVSQNYSTDTKSLEDDAELLDFQHKRIYNQYLHERELISSLRNTELFRITILGVVATCWITVFLSLFSIYKNPSLDVALLLILLVSSFIGNLLSFYTPLLIFHFKSSRLADKFVVNDRKNILDDDFISTKAEMQKNDIELWKRRMEQTKRYTANSSKRLQKSEFRYYLFIVFSIMTLFGLILVAICKIHFPEYTAQIFIGIILSVSVIFMYGLLVSDLPDQVRNTIRLFNRKKSPLSISNLQYWFSKNETKIRLSGIAKSKYPKLMLWLCTTNKLINVCLIPIDKNSGMYNEEFTVKFSEDITAGTDCYGILVMSGTRREQKVQFFHDSHGLQYIAEVLGRGNVDTVSEIELSHDWKTRSLPQKICSLLDDVDDDIYVKFHFVYNPDSE